MTRNGLTVEGHVFGQVHGAGTLRGRTEIEGQGNVRDIGRFEHHDASRIDGSLDVVYIVWKAPSRVDDRRGACRPSLSWYCWERRENERTN
jgi:hypothetical protein